MKGKKKVFSQGPEKILVLNAANIPGESFRTELYSQQALTMLLSKRGSGIQAVCTDPCLLYLGLTCFGVE